MESLHLLKLVEFCLRVTMQNPGCFDLLPARMCGARSQVVRFFQIEADSCRLIGDLCANDDLPSEWLKQISRLSVKIDDVPGHSSASRFKFLTQRATGGFNVGELALSKRHTVRNSRGHARSRSGPSHSDFKSRA